MADTYVNLHSHLHTSLLDGHGKPQDYVKRVVELGQPAAAVTDHGNLHGWLQFYDACKKNNVTPILGAELYQARKTRHDKDDEERAGRANDELLQRGPHHLTLLAKNAQGYRNLIKLSSLAFTDGFYGKPRIDHELIDEFHEGIVILSGCLNSQIAQALLRGDDGVARQTAGFFQDVVGPDNFFIEIQDHGIVEESRIRNKLLDLARSLNAKVVPTGDTHYVLKEHAFSHDLLLCVSTGATLAQENRFKFSGDDYYLKSYEEMCQLFPPEWLRNTVDIAEGVDLDLKFGELHFPDFPVPPGETIDSIFNKLVQEGIRYRYGESPAEEVMNRINYELRVIKSSGFQEYFLVVWDFIRWARENRIRVGGGRGSAAGSCVSYCLRITNVDPLRFGLLFERFLIEGRKSPPDIDIDIDDRYKDRVIEYVRNKYGDDRVAHICTFNTIGAKQALRDSARVLGYEYALGDKLSKLVPPPVLGVTKTIDQSLQTREFSELYESDADARRIVDAARSIEGIIRQTSLHAGGIVISRGPITDYLPVMQRPLKSGQDGPLVTQWDMDEVERCGLPKIDFLALRNLSVVDITLDHLREKGIDIDTDEIPLDDEETYRELRAGHTMGVFQVEGTGITERCVALQPHKLEDVTDLVALYRPGPMGTGMDRMFIARRHGRSQVKYDHLKLKEVLHETYGLMVYQEQLLKVAEILAGFSPADRDLLRKAVGKKIPEQIVLYREKFVQGCIETSGMSEELGNKIYDDIEYFAGYGFSRCHGLPYSLLTYHTAYLKTHHPTEYMAALLSSVDIDRMAPYLNECRRLGINVISPSINKSESDFKVLSNKEILFGLNSIKGIGPVVIEKILGSRVSDYDSMYDFMRRIHPEVLNKSVLERMIKAGAFDELVPEQRERLLSRDEKLEILQLEKDELGLYVTEHPYQSIAQYLEPLVSCSIQELETRHTGEKVKLGGLITKVTHRTTKKGSKMFNLILEDLTGSIEILVFPRDAANNKFVEGDFVVIEGRLQREGEGEDHSISKIFFSSHTKPSLPQFEGGDPITLNFTDPPTPATIKRLEQLIDATSGDSPVYIEFTEEGNTIVVKFKKPTNRSIKEDLELVSLGERIVF